MPATTPVWLLIWPVAETPMPSSARGSFSCAVRNRSAAASHRGQDGSLPAVKADALLGFGKDAARFVHKAQLDAGAADVNGKILFHPAFPFLLLSFVHGVDGTGKAGRDLGRR